MHTPKLKRERMCASHRVQTKEADRSLPVRILSDEQSTDSRLSSAWPSGLSELLKSACEQPPKACVSSRASFPLGMASLCFLEAGRASLQWTFLQLMRR
jgi:hypothetical protein